LHGEVRSWRPPQPLLLVLAAEPRSLWRSDATAADMANDGFHVEERLIFLSAYRGRKRAALRPDVRRARLQQNSYAGVRCAYADYLERNYNRI
jgi:hypothetical protein